jgi:hypothetical protein
MQPSKRTKGLFIADPEIGGALSILRFPSPTPRPSSSSGSATEESVFYSPIKYDIPPPAWSPTGVLQPLPDVSSPVSKGKSLTNEPLDGDSSGDISDLLNDDLIDLPDVTMSLPTRKKRMTLVVEVPRVQDVLKRWSSDSGRPASASAADTSTSMFSFYHQVELGLIFVISAKECQGWATRACAPNTVVDQGTVGDG